MGDPPGSALDCDGTEAYTIFVNFDGPTLIEGSDDATMNTTEVGFLAMDLPAYPGTDTSEILSVMGEHWKYFDVCVTGERPVSGAYTMVVVTVFEESKEVCLEGSHDCGNAGTDSNVQFVFSGCDADTGTVALANLASAAGAYAYGLEAEESDWTDLMCVAPPGLNWGTPCADLGSQRKFQDACFVSAVGLTACAHGGSCGDAEQNSYQELLAILGPAK